MDEKILSILACPETHSPLVLGMYNGAPVLVCTEPTVHRCYPVVDGIPDLLIESAILLSESEHQELLKAAVKK